MASHSRSISISDDLWLRCTKEIKGNMSKQISRFIKNGLDNKPNRMELPDYIALNWYTTQPNKFEELKEFYKRLGRLIEDRSML